MWVLIEGRTHLLQQILKILDAFFFNQLTTGWSTGHIYPRLWIWTLWYTETENSSYDWAWGLQRYSVSVTRASSKGGVTKHNKRPPPTVPDTMLPEFWPLCFSRFLPLFWFNFFSDSHEPYQPYKTFNFQYTILLNFNMRRKIILINEEKIIIKLYEFSQSQYNHIFRSLIMKWRFIYWIVLGAGNWT